MKFTIVLIIFSFWFSTLFAQNSYTIKGTVGDTASRAKLANTAVIILNAKDSVLQVFTRAGTNGAFAINKLTKGKFILLATYPGYADYVEEFALDSAHTTHDFGNINLILKSKLLADVIIKGTHTAIKIKGDTTEFNAKAYVVQPNDKVEDLLRQLPGITVDKDGKITAQGQTVSKVLVDGEEFFGDDPTLVTKNIRADMVDKVQLYDKKSDQAAFTGIDDGVRTKTINIKLKEDKKNGVFGKVNANAGTDDYYEGQLLFNKFKAKMKFSAYGTLANDGRTGLGFQDASKIGATGGDIQFIDGGISINISGGNDALDSFNGYFDGKGIPVTRSGGLHFDTKWNSDKESLNTNFKIGSIEVTGSTNTVTQQTSQTGVINRNSDQTFDNYSFRQKLDLTYQLKLDTSSNLKITADGTLKNFHVDNNYLTNTDSTGILLNRNKRSVINSGDSRVFNFTALYTKKFKKVGRTFSWSVSEAYNQNTTQGYLNSEIDYYNPKGGLDSTRLTNQYKTTSSLSSVINSNMTFSEPITKKLSVLFNYGFGLNNSSTDKATYDQSTPGNYNIFDNTYSNNYKFNQLTNQVGAILNYKNKKATLNFGTKVSGVNFEQDNEFTGGVFKRNFINWAPQATFQYRFSQQHAFYASYNGSTTQPTIDQIQPVPVNTDPLNITIGNQNLQPSFTNRIFMYYNNYQVLTSQSVFINGSFSNTSNAIVNNTVETSGKNVTQYVNLTNHQPLNYNLYASFGRKTNIAGIEAGVEVGTSGNISYSYINNALDKGKSFTYSITPAFSKYEQKKYDFSISGGPSYTFSSMSLQPQINNNAAGFTSRGSVNVYLPARFGTGTNVQYNYTAKTNSFDAQYKTIWNAYVYKAFNKEETFKLSLSVNDLLNQNTNYSRGITGNTTTQTNTTGIKRFFMLSLIWDFTKFGIIPAKN